MCPACYSYDHAISQLVDYQATNLKARHFVLVVAFSNYHLVSCLREEDEYPKETGEEDEDAEAREGWLLGEGGEEGSSWGTLHLSNQLLCSTNTSERLGRMGAPA